MKFEISIVYSCKNISESLLESIRTVNSGAGKASYEIIIISNEIHILKTLNKNPKLKIIKSNDSFQAKGKYLLFINKDILFAPFSIEKMLLRIEKNNKIGIIAPMVLGPDNMIVGNKSILFRILSFKYKFPNAEINREQFVDIVDGNCLLISKILFEKVNGFDEKFFQVFKQLNLCIKVKKEGYKNLYYPEAKILNYHLTWIT